MRDWVSEWVQEGRLYVWRYANAGRSWRGWQWMADPAGCRSIRNLLDRMQGGEPKYRMLRLDPVTDAILSVPNAGFPVAEQFTRLRIEYRTGFDALLPEPAGETLNLAVGGLHLRKLSGALGRVEIGDGDFDIRPSDDRKADRWMFWWMPDIDYRQGKRS